MRMCGTCPREQQVPGGHLSTNRNDERDQCALNLPFGLRQLPAQTRNSKREATPANGGGGERASRRGKLTKEEHIRNTAFPAGRICATVNKRLKINPATASEGRHGGGDSGQAADDESHPTGEDEARSGAAARRLRLRRDRRAGEPDGAPRPPGRRRRAQGLPGCRPRESGDPEPRRRTDAISLAVLSPVPPGCPHPAGMTTPGGAPETPIRR